MSVSTKSQPAHRPSGPTLPTWLSDRTGEGFRTLQTRSPTPSSHRRATGSDPFPDEDAAEGRHRDGAQRACLQSDAGHEHRRRQAADRGDGGLTRPNLGGCATSQQLKMCVGPITVASRRKSEKYARNERTAAQPSDQGPPTPHPKRYHAAKTLSRLRRL